MIEVRNFLLKKVGQCRRDGPWVWTHPASAKGVHGINANSARKIFAITPPTPLPGPSLMVVCRTLQAVIIKNIVLKSPFSNQIEEQTDCKLFMMAISQTCPTVSETMPAVLIVAITG